MSEKQEVIVEMDDFELSDSDLDFLADILISEKEIRGEKNAFIF